MGKKNHETMNVAPARMAGAAILMLALVASCGGEREDTPFAVEETTIAAVQSAFLGGELTCLQLVESYLDRIHRFDQDLSGGWPINSVLWVNEHARDRAASLDTHFRQTGELLGPLHCVPVLLKDNYDTQEMPTTAGSLTMLGARPPDDAFTVSRLREAGALLFAKATMDAWAMGASGESSRPRAGNPYDTAYLTSSSSSGSAAAVSANFTLVATGSDTCGSLSSPGSVNGVVAIRSSHGLVSQDGIIPLAHSHDVGGPIARTVEDAVRVLNTMAGIDPGDPSTTADPAAQRFDDYTRFLDPEGARGKQIGVLRSYGTGETTGWTAPTEEKHTDQAKAFGAALDLLRAAGAVVVDPPIDFSLFKGHYLADYEAEVHLGEYLGSATYRPPVRDVHEIAKHALVHPNVKARLVEKVIPQINPGDVGYADLVRDNRDTKGLFDWLMDQNRLDALVLLGDQGCRVSVTAGVPYMVVPAGFRSGGDPRPVGLGIMTRKWDERTMIQIAYAFERARGPRTPPVISSWLLGDAKLAPLDPSAYNACVEQIALKARELQGPNYKNITPRQYREYVRQAPCTLPTHQVARVK